MKSRVHPGGNFYYWQCGAALYLNEAFNLSSDDSLSLIGASAGSITAALFKVDCEGANGRILLC